MSDRAFEKMLKKPKPGEEEEKPKKKVRRKKPSIEHGRRLIPRPISDKQDNEDDENNQEGAEKDGEDGYEVCYLT